MPKPKAHPSVLLLRLAALGALTFSVATLVGYFLSFLGAVDFCGPGGGCETVRNSEVGQQIADYLPILGVLGYSAVFAGALVEQRGTLRFVAGAAILGGLAALAFLGLQAFVIGEWCSLCIGADVSGLVAAAAGVWVITSKAGTPGGSASFMSPWWGLWWLAWIPLAWTLTFPEPPVPPEIRALYDDSADVNVVEMADFECPYCRAMNPALEGVIEETEADVHLVRLMVPLPFHEHARGAAAAYFCAQRQERGEPMASALFETEDLTREGLVAVAERLELDVGAFRACLDEDAIDQRIEEDRALADRAGMRGLPTVYIGDRVIRGFAPGFESEYRAAIDETLTDGGRRVRTWPLAGLGLIALIAAAIGARPWRRKKAK